MRRRQGFTLVELLVVMAIIAILAAIVVPNASKFIGRARVTRALAEITGMETAITAMVTDAGKSQLSQLFRLKAVPAYVAGPSVPESQWGAAVAGNLQTALDIYTSVVGDLLRQGRGVLADPSSTAPNFMDRNVLSKLGTNYMDVNNDSWGNSYQILPGPWNLRTPGIANSSDPIYLRKFSVDTGTSGRQPRDDGYSLRGGTKNNHDWVTNELSGTIGEDEVPTWPDKVGFPADKNKSAYIWSWGPNLRNSQMVYTAEFDPGNAVTWYPGAVDGADLGGGDDVNNWDKDASWGRFSN